MNCPPAHFDLVEKKEQKINRLQARGKHFPNRITGERKPAAVMLARLLHTV
jgi:hypothetical protein